MLDKSFINYDVPKIQKLKLVLLHELETQTPSWSKSCPPPWEIGANVSEREGRRGNQEALEE